VKTISGITFMTRSWIIQIKALVSLAFLASIAFFMVAPSFPFLDLPNHSARCFIMSELLFSGTSHFSDFYSLRLGFVPYLLGDLVYAMLFKVFDWSLAERLWVTSAYICLPLAVCFYAYARRLKPLRILLLLLLSMYLATNYYFLSGFLHYQIGMAVAFLTLGAWEYFCRSKSLSTIYLSIAGLGLLLTYFTHAAAAFFLMVSMGSIIAIRMYHGRISFEKILLSCLPMGALGLFLLIRGGADSGLSNPIVKYRSFGSKILSFWGPIIRFDPGIDFLLFALFLFALTIPLLSSISRGNFKFDKKFLLNSELFFVSTVCFLFYLILPVGANSVNDIDVRALPFFLLFCALGFAEKKTALQIPQIAVALILVTLNFSYLGFEFEKTESQIKLYKEAVLQIPTGHRLLSVGTVPDVGRIQPFVHLATPYAAQVSEHSGNVPYLFTLNIRQPQTYFKTKDTLTAPSPFWYLRGEQIDWKNYSDLYDFLIVTRPFEVNRFTGLRLEAYFENEGASVFRILR